ncbi:hypothetical protein, partial [Novilysobacter selenitireducens]
FRAIEQQLAKPLLAQKEQVASGDEGEQQARQVSLRRYNKFASIRTEYLESGHRRPWFGKLVTTRRKDAQRPKVASGSHHRGRQDSVDIRGSHLA